MTALTDFLLARFTEEVARARFAGPIDGPRLIVDATVKRELVENWLAWQSYGVNDTSVLEVLAWQYSEHPDCRPEWLPRVD